MYLRVLFIMALIWTPLAASDMTAEAESVNPYRLTGEVLKRWCASSSLTNRGRWRNRYCDGFVSGVEEGMRAIGLAQADNPQSHFCVPPGTTSRQLAKAYVGYATKQKNGLDRPAAQVTLEALKSTYPCDKY